MINYMQKIQFRILLALLVSLTLSSCGYQLRQTYPVYNAIGALDLKCEGNAWRLCQRLRNQFEIQNLILRDDALVRLSVAPIESRNRPLTITSDASISEYELSQQVNYTLELASSNTTILKQSVKASRRYQHDNTELLSRERKIEELNTNLQEQLADNLLNQLSILEPSIIESALSRNQ